jgi:hypothetical protein
VTRKLADDKFEEKMQEVLRGIVGKIRGRS